MSLKKRLYIFWEVILGLYKSIYVCFRYLPIKQAIQLPILVSKNCRLVELHGKILISSPTISMGMILIGIGSVGFIDKSTNKSILEIGRGGIIEFYGKARFGNGIKITCSGVLSFGKNVVVTGNVMIMCHKAITIGNDCLFSWNIEIMDTDIHKIYTNKLRSNQDEAITIGNHVWISSGAKILKGVSINKNIVIAANSIISKTIEQENCIYGGIGGHMLKENIEWEK